MASTRIPEKPSVALLSVTGGDVSAARTPNDKANTELAGGSLVEYQIKTLCRVGITRFLVEVENVDGAMLALADRFRQQNVFVDFVRTGADIQHYLKLDDRIWVQSGQLYVQPDFVETLSKSTDNFVATVDGRDENSLFERIDLNTRWAGISIVGASTIAMLKDLPQDWSIISSLLRQAILANVPLKLLSQQHVNNGTLNIVQGPQDFVQLNKQILRRRVLSQPGVVEARVLGPVSAKLIPIIWQSPIALNLVKLAGPIFALGAVALGVSGFDLAATGAALGAVATNSLRLTTTDDLNGQGKMPSLTSVTLALLVIAMFGAAYMDTSYTNDGLFAAFAVASIAWISMRIVLPRWADGLLRSPALLSILALVGTAGLDFTNALQWIMVAQLSAFMFACYDSGPDKKADQP
jgi:choline kinase